MTNTNVMGGKPADSFQYLENFISEAKCIIDNGIIYEKIKYSIKTKGSLSIL